MVDANFYRSVTQAIRAAKAFGGLKTLKAISAGNAIAYLEHPKVFACGGSWMVRSELIAAGQFDKITSLTREAVNLVQNMKSITVNPLSPWKKKLSEIN